ncbi:ribbon-helix-helix domain-containing protein [Alteraurantiacibacter buctensis]|uniref:Ribbon-helix-helix protein, CopG family n=1 Tax=Alteraurantiacibacter buctensis TaxID=1503981 RepID=A0A844YYL2_9SPHN|nr:ribbon-helix-helix protein, CopG family [Alteraurantiacibacter buctensis]MXO72050.1 ribbon-helix-helix protein, CopG family [Alteraurantiacibacter buctensis]
MARFLVDIPEEDLARLDALAKAEGKSRAAILREAVADYIAAESKQGFEKYFGLWERHGSTVDGLTYEEQMRSEWPDAPVLATPKTKRTAA